MSHLLEAGRQLLAKALAESCFEGSLVAEPLGQGQFQVRLQSGHCYRFSARQSPWDFLLIDPASITRGGKSAASPQQWLLDAQAELALSDITLGNLLAEVQNTLYSDANTLARQRDWPVRRLAELDGVAIQGLLAGHPKILASKGRVGWGQEALAQYSPEGDQDFALRWLAISKDCAQAGISAGQPWPALWRQALRDNEWAAISQRLGADWQSRYWLLPVHPWQWQQHIALQYAELLASGALVDLGPMAARYRAQLSVRTLSGPGDYDLKLPLTVLNTSCYRGIPGQYIGVGPALSDWLAQITWHDSELKHLLVQRELAGIHVPHPWQRQVKGSPYRYQEMLGAVWRDSLEARLKPGQQSRLMASLMHKDASGQSLVAEHVRRSGLSPQDWLTALFEVTVVPLYHLMCRYGVGLVAHGQNIALVLDNHRPVAAAIKDFHGDLRLWEEPKAEAAGLDPAVSQVLTKLPAHYLIHDLVTGHLVTTLRFISPLFEQDLGLDERQFYALLAQALRRYQARQPALAPAFAAFDLFTPELLRMCLNKVRYRLGYDDSAERPLPALGHPLANPLLHGEQS